MRYDCPEADEWVQPIPVGYRLACCDCSLVHEIDFRVISDETDPELQHVQFRVRRNNRATAAMRRQR